MTRPSPILITGAGGEVGSVSQAIVRRLLEREQPVRAFVRRDDERAAALRAAGAEVFLGDLLNLADVTQALQGCQRVYFSMSLSPYYLDANLLMIAAARATGGIEAFVNISEFEQSYMTFEKMSAAREQRRAWLGGLVDDWSPQQRAHWLAEQALTWSGLPAVHIRATMFVENPLLTRFPLQAVLEKGELCLPFGSARIAPIAAADVAEVCATILLEPHRHLGQAYALTGPESKNMQELATDFSAVIGRDVVYVPQSLETSDQAINQALGTRSPHTCEHLQLLPRLVLGGRYVEVTDTLERLMGRPPTTVREALRTSLQRQHKGVAPHGG